jgi:heptosyltransferase-2
MHETEHEIERNLNLLKYSGIEVTTDQMAISVSIVALKKIEDRLRDLKIENSIPKIGLAPGSNANGWWKRWGKERYLELARQIIDNYPKASIILIGGKDEEEEANFIIEQLNDKSAISFVNKTSIKEFIALIHLCDLVIGNDTGPVHVASALNRPAICIWGPSYYQRAHLRHKTGINIWKNVPCSPCYKDSGTKKVLSCNDRVCLSTITVDEVFTAVQELLTQLDC